MSIWQALILGVVQGLTEFIPVSSSGHLVLLHEWFGAVENGLAFDVALHAGTLAALLIYFHKDIFRYAKSIVKKSDDTKIALYLLIATLPAAFFGYFLETAAETVFRSPRIVVLNLFVVGLIMLFVEKIYDTIRHHKLEKTSLNQALIVGLAQAAAIVPGVSRSGSTIIAGILTGYDRATAARFSFLLGIPIIAGAVAKVAVSGSFNGIADGELGVFTAGIVSAFVSGLFAISFMLKFLGSHGLNAFAYYRIGLAVVATLIFIF